MNKKTTFTIMLIIASFFVVRSGIYFYNSEVIHGLLSLIISNLIVIIGYLMQPIKVQARVSGKDLLFLLERSKQEEKN